MLFVLKQNLLLVFPHGNGCIIGWRLIRFDFTFYMPDFLFADPGMTSGTLVLCSKSILAVVAGAAIPASVKRFHDEIFLFLGKQGLHFKQAAVTFFAADLFDIHMVLMPEDNGFYRFGIKNTATVGKTAPAGNADISDAEKCEHDYEEIIFFHFK